MPLGRSLKAQQPPLAEVSKRAMRRNFWRSETAQPEIEKRD